MKNKIETLEPNKLPTSISLHMQNLISCYGHYI